MTKTEIITIVIYLIVYAVVFIIQKTQFEKQKSIMEKYEKMFSIINIDEIEKYVNVKEKSLKLELENRDIETKSLLNKVSSLIEKSEDRLKEINELVERKDEVDKMLLDAKVLMKKRESTNESLSKLDGEEFEKIYQTVFDKIKPLEDKNLESSLDLELLLIRKEYLAKKIEVLK
jgi:hypothetical protein